MNNLIKVVGKDMNYPSIDTYLYINAAIIITAYPSYAVKGVGGDWWVCVPSHEDAQLVTYKLKCSDGNVYTCSSEEELAKIGLSIESEKPKKTIGFVHDINGEKIAQEIAKK
jgi:hypothetical protein